MHIVAQVSGEQRRRPPDERGPLGAAKKGARTKGPANRSAAAKKAARTRSAKG